MLFPRIHIGFISFLIHLHFNAIIHKKQKKTKQNKITANNSCHLWMAARTKNVQRASVVFISQ